MPNKPRILVGDRVHFPSEVEHATCPGCPGWKAHSNQMSKMGWQCLPQLQGLPFDCTPGLGGWRLQVPVGGLGCSRVILGDDAFPPQALANEALLKVLDGLEPDSV